MKALQNARVVQGKGHADVLAGLKRSTGSRASICLICLHDGLAERGTGI